MNCSFKLIPSWNKKINQVYQWDSCGSTQRLFDLCYHVVGGSSFLLNWPTKVVNHVTLDVMSSRCRLHKKYSEFFQTFPFKKGQYVHECCWKEWNKEPEEMFPFQGVYFCCCCWGEEPKCLYFLSSWTHFTTLIFDLLLVSWGVKLYFTDFN